MRIIFIALLGSILCAHSFGQIFHENFEYPDSVIHSSNGGGSWSQNSNLKTSGLFCDSASIVSPSDSISMTTIAFSTVGYNYVFLYFNHIAKVEFFDACFVEASPDGGLTWITLCQFHYLGNSLLINQACRFQEASYSNWQPGSPSSPDSTWWKREIFDLTTVLYNVPNAKVRFVMRDLNNSGGANRAGWFIDDIVVSDSLDLNLSAFNNRLTGKVFVDLNSNLVQDAGEPPAMNTWISTINSNYTASTYYSGNYKLDVSLSGIVDIEPTPYQYSSTYFTVSPVTHSANFTGFQNVDSLNDFAFQPNGVFNDLAFDIHPVTPLFNPVNQGGYLIFYKNKGTTFQNASIVIYPDTALTYVNSTFIPPTSVSPDSIVWDLPNLAPLQYGFLYVYFNVDTNLIMGTVLSTWGTIFPVAGDFNPLNNSDTAANRLGTSFDPNEITVSQEVIYTPDLVSPPELDYTIYFQNTGNDTAHYVRIHNVIPVNVDMNSFQLIAASHNVILNYDSVTGQMRFTFNNIMLPDSTTNEPASHGFVIYRIKPLTTLLAGDSILNSAEIYFDFNAPILTNTVVTEIIDPTSVYESLNENLSWNLYPNPVNNELNVIYKLKKESMVTLDIFNLYGKHVKTLYQKFNSAGTFKHVFDISSFSNGVYITRFSDAEIINLKKFVKVN